MCCDQAQERKVRCLPMLYKVRGFLYTGIAYHMATSGGSGGSTTTAESSRKFYSDPEMRERLALLCPEEKRAIVRQILTNGEYFMTLSIYANF